MAYDRNYPARDGWSGAAAGDGLDLRRRGADRCTTAFAATFGIARRIDAKVAIALLPAARALACDRTVEHPRRTAIRRGCGAAGQYCYAGVPGARGRPRVVTPGTR